MNTPTKHQLSNGMTVLCIPSSDHPVITLQAWIRFGAADESEDIAGIAHVFEHLLFKGTHKRKVGQIAREIESLGGDLNAYTTYDHTVMHMTLPANTWAKGLDVLADALLNSTVEEDEMKRELEVILEEIKRRNDMPAARSVDLLRGELFKGHTYARPVIGYAEIVKDFTREKIVEQYRKHYHAQNIFLVIAGDYKHNELIKECERLFAAMPAPQASTSANTLANTLDTTHRGQITPVSNSRQHFSTTPTPDAILRLGWTIPNGVHPDTAALDALALILGQGDSSRLVKRLIIKDQLVRSVGCDTWTPQDSGCLTISFMGPKGCTQKNNQILEAIFQELHQPIEASELAKAKKNLLSSAIYSKESVDGLAQRYGFYEAIAADFNFDQKYLDQVAALSISDLERVKKQYLNWDHVVYAGIYPESDPAPKLITPTISKTPAVPTKNKTAASKTTVKRFNYRGLTVLLKHSSHLPIFSASWVGLGGQRLEPAKKAGLGTLWARTVSEGAKLANGQVMDKNQISEYMDGLSASLGAFHGRNSFGLELDGLSEDFENLFDVLVGALKAPLFDQSDSKQNLSHLLVDIKTSKDNPNSVAREALNQALFAGSPIARPGRGTPQTLRGLGPKDLLAYHRTLMKQPQVLCVVGDVSEKQLKTALDKHFAQQKFPTTSALKKPIAIKALKNNHRIQQHLKKEQTHIYWAFRTCSFKHKDRWPLTALSAVLSGQGGRLFAELRVNLSLCYTVAPTSAELYDDGYFGFYIATSPEKQDLAMQALQGEVSRLIREGVSSHEWNEARQFYIGNHLIGQQRLSQQGLGMALDELYGNGYQEFFNFSKRLQSVRAEDIQKVAAKYLNAKNKASIWSIAGPKTNKA